jgi:hypothetical protein
MLASEVLTLLNSSSQTERLPGTHVVVSHPETEDHQMNATRVPYQVRQEMMTFLSELARLRSVVSLSRGADGAEEPKCHPPRSGDQPRRCWDCQLYFKFIAPGQT